LRRDALVATQIGYLIPVDWGVMEILDLAVVGGGLAGLATATSAEAAGLKTALIDAGVPGSRGDLGGFAPFSGAKFSLFPAGSGLIPVLGSEEALVRRYELACADLASLGFPQFKVTAQQLRGEEAHMESGLDFRKYHSVLLSPSEIGNLLAELGSRLRQTQVIRAKVLSIRTLDTSVMIDIEGRKSIEAKKLVLAAGRLGSDLLRAAGVPETGGKGIDIGIRLSFSDRSPLERLRSLGPDAKFIAGPVRTFCLNSPGRIFHYPALGLQVPGGVVADEDWPEANVGILYRTPRRQEVLNRVGMRRAEQEGPFSQIGSGANLGWNARSRGLVGEDVTSAIDDFVGALTASGLVELPRRYCVHYPLLDWHWPVFSLPGTLRTRAPGVFAAGDSSGHARGLMQAFVMGKIAAEEAVG
jgi:hypothetical protein